MIGKLLLTVVLCSTTIKARNTCLQLPKVYLNAKAPSNERPFAFLTASELRAITDAITRFERCAAWVMVRRDKDGNTKHLHIQWAPSLRRLK